MNLEYGFLESRKRVSRINLETRLGVCVEVRWGRGVVSVWECMVCGCREGMIIGGAMIPFLI